ncbi:SHOCT domain-containing protein [Natronococcus sp. A-GB1]|uniref:SHOCT domain-containing protein n=1 Tax=Natronococcus sp. A-GB1 TaxID=3037648 RepID=UPI0024201ACA|nr:SHOCT domain-containing protein [Natronococcus sp. A-GB1]MDG5761039.1 SHOCT domain-containing protein [Natronococcus sp. A-GB1]
MIAVERPRTAADETVVRTLLLVLAVLFLLSVLLMLLAVPMMGLRGGSHVWTRNETAGWFTVLLWLFPLAVILGDGYLLYRALVGSSSRRSDPALEELRVAYARGDLSDEEFEKRRNWLRSEDERP